MGILKFIFSYLLLIIIAVPVDADQVTADIKTGMDNAHWAVVARTNALAYSDQALNNPIGHLRYGEKIQVSKKAMARGQAVATMSSGRLVYVRVEDLYFPHAPPDPKLYHRQVPEVLAGEHQLYLQEKSHQLFFTLGIQDWGEMYSLEESNRGTFIQGLWEHLIWGPWGTGAAVSIGQVDGSLTSITEFGLHWRWWFKLPLDLLGELRILGQLGLTPLYVLSDEDKTHYGTNWSLGIGPQWVWEFSHNWMLESSFLVKSTWYSGRLSGDIDSSGLLGRSFSQWSAGISIGHRF